MPRALEGGGVFPVVLASDRDKPDPPTFLFRHLTVREFRMLVKSLEQIQTSAGKTEMIMEAVDSLGKVLVGWQNMRRADGTEIAFDAAELESICDLTEMMELVGMVVSGGALSADDRKKSEPQP